MEHTMGNHYRQVRPEDRLVIYKLLLKGHSFSEIAQQVGFNRATIYRELVRNSCWQGYRPDWASQQALWRKRRCGVAKLDKNAALKSFVLEKLQQRWSPELIAGRLKLQNSPGFISHESIYRYIYSESGKPLKLYRYLQKERRFRYPRIKRGRRYVARYTKTPILERAAEINTRESFGHWEGDLVLFRKTKTNLFTLRERKSRFILAIRNQCRKAKSTADTLLKYMQNNLHKTVKTLTLDNDPAFSLHATISQSMRADIYFCEPYKSYQKGGIENANKLIRTKLPRRTKINGFAQDRIDKIIQGLNNRPMKCLNYETPNEVFRKAFGQLPFLAACCT